MTPRERMRARKEGAADEKAKKIKKLAEEKFEENRRRKEELKSRNLHMQSINILKDYDETDLTHSQPVSTQDYKSIGQQELFTTQELSSNEAADRLCMSEPVKHAIQEGSYRSTVFYKDKIEDRESSSEESEEEIEEEEVEDLEEVEEEVEEELEEEVEEEEVEEEALDETLEPTYRQDSDFEAMIMYMEKVLGSTVVDTGTVTGMSPAMPPGCRAINDTMAWTKLKRMRESAIQNLGEKVFENVYKYLRNAKEQSITEDEVKMYLESVGSSSRDCFEVDQLLYFEDQLQETSRTLVES